MQYIRCIKVLLGPKNIHILYISVNTVFYSGISCLEIASFAATRPAVFVHQHLHKNPFCSIKLISVAGFIIK